MQTARSNGLEETKKLARKVNSGPLVYGGHICSQDKQRRATYHGRQTSADRTISNSKVDVNYPAHKRNVRAMKELSRPPCRLAFVPCRCLKRASTAQAKAPRRNPSTALCHTLSRLEKLLAMIADIFRG